MKKKNIDSSSPTTIPTSKKKKSGSKSKKPKLVELATLPEPLKLAGLSRELCQKCGLLDSCAMSTPWIPEGWTGKLLIVGPPPEEDREYIRPLKPKIGKWLRGLASSLGYSDGDIGFISAIRAGCETPSMDQLRCCRPFLVYAINKLKPRGILGLGKYALRALTNSNTQNITKARGKNLEVPGVNNSKAAH